MSQPRWTPYLLFTIAAAALFATGLTSHPVGRDEAVSILAARHPVDQLLHLIAQHEPHPAGYYLVLAFWPHDTLLAARLFSFLPAVACVPLLIAIAGRLGLPRWPTGALAATAPFLGFYSVEARMYSWLALVGTVALLIAVEVTNSPTSRPEMAVLAGVVLAIAGYVHYFAAFLALTVLLWLWLRGRRGHAVIAFATASLLYLPGLVLLSQQIPVFRRYPTGTWQAREDPSHVYQAFSVLLAGAESYAPAFAATAVFLIAVAFALHRGRALPGVRLLAFWLLPTLALPLAIGAVVPLDSPRYLAACFPALLLLLAGSTAGLARRQTLATTAVLVLIGAALCVDSTHREDNTKPPVPAALAMGGPDRLVVVQHLLLAPEVAFYTADRVALTFPPPAIDRVGYWALPPRAAYPPAERRPLLIINYCGRLEPPPAGYVVQRRERFAMNLCGETANPA